MRHRIAPTVILLLAFFAYDAAGILLAAQATVKAAAAPNGVPLLETHPHPPYPGNGARPPMLPPTLPPPPVFANGRIPPESCSGLPVPEQPLPVAQLASEFSRVSAQGAVLVAVLVISEPSGISTYDAATRRLVGTAPNLFDPPG